MTHSQSAGADSAEIPRGRFLLIGWGLVLLSFPLGIGVWYAPAMVWPAAWSAVLVLLLVITVAVGYCAVKARSVLLGAAVLLPLPSPFISMIVMMMIWQPSMYP